MDIIFVNLFTNNNNFEKWYEKFNKWYKLQFRPLVHKNVRDKGVPYGILP